MYTLFLSTDPSPPASYPLSLHDALPISMTSAARPTARLPRWTKCQSFAKPSTLEYWHIGLTTMRLPSRSEEHTSELQSRGHLVCRLLLEKKKIVSNNTRLGLEW